MESANIDVNKLLINDRESIKKFTTEFNSINNNVNENIVSTMNRLTTSISEEANIYTSFKSLEEQLNSIVLATTLKNLVAIKTSVAEKFKEYNELLLTNNKLATSISSNIRENKQVIDGIYKTVSIINENIKSINDTLDKIGSQH
jgi:regulator of replication initiation timing